MAGCVVVLAPKPNRPKVVCCGPVVVVAAGVEPNKPPVFAVVFVAGEFKLNEYFDIFEYLKFDFFLFLNLNERLCLYLIKFVALL